MIRGMSYPGSNIAALHFDGPLLIELIELIELMELKAGLASDNRRG